MKAKLMLFMVCITVSLLSHLSGLSQRLTGYNFKIVNMFPRELSNELRNDAEPNIAVNPANPNIIAGSAFTINPTGSLTSAPIFISTDGGSTWALNNILPSANGRHNGITLGFGTSSGILYAGILKGGSRQRCMMLRTATPSASTMMTTLVDRSTELVEQPFVSAATVNDAGGIARDRLFSGDNLFSSSIMNGGNGRTAEVMFSNNASAAPPAGITNRIVEVRTAFEQDLGATRMAIHKSGVVYGVYYRWTSGSYSLFRSDVVVIRDDNFATGANPFNALVDGADGLAGQRVVTDRPVPAFGDGHGINRLAASHLTIAVDPNNSANVFIAWLDQESSTSHYTLHFRRSINSGQTWGAADWLTVTDAFNPDIAITTDGKVGLIYQRMTAVPGPTIRWDTHFRLADVSGTTFTDDILSTFLDSDFHASPEGNLFLGHYLRMQAVGNTFYGVFSASNRPIRSNFPRSVTYKRNANFTTNQIRDLSNTRNWPVSIDPFFFRISPGIESICELYPEACNFKLLDRLIIRFPPYPSWPCLHCPEFEIKFEDIYREVFKDSRPKTKLSIPYFHLSLDGFNPTDFDIVIKDNDGFAIKQQLNKTANGYSISFRPSKNNFNAKEGVHGLKLTAIPKTEAAARKETTLNYRLEASDYQFKEHIAANN